LFSRSFLRNFPAEADPSRVSRCANENHVRSKTSASRSRISELNPTPHRERRSFSLEERCEREWLKGNLLARDGCFVKVTTPSTFTTESNECDCDSGLSSQFDARTMTIHDTISRRFTRLPITRSRSRASMYPSRSYSRGKQDGKIR